MDYQKELNEKQYEAVSTSSQYVRIIAGAGTGKTRVLTYRIAYLISEMGVNPYQILAITFTNKVAKEMKIRAINLLERSNINAQGLSVSTFHSFCARFLRSEIPALGYPSSFVIYDDDDTEKLVKSIAQNFGYKKNDEVVRLALKYIETNKCKGIYPKDLKGKKETFPLEKECRKIFARYEERLEAMFAVDFDDLLLKTIRILKEFPEVQKKWQNRIGHILIDEYQDTNDIQDVLISLLLKKTTTLYVVGDPDQTIYTWRGANQNIILELDKKYALETIILNRNYRSTPTILRTANRLIDYNKLRIKKDLFTELPEGNKVQVKKTLRQEDEAFWVIKEIQHLHERKKVRYKDIAILYRANYLTQPFEKELMMNQIPYQVFGGIRFYQRQEIKDVIAYFRLLLNPKDDVSLLRIINLPRRGLGAKTISTLTKEANKANLSIVEYIYQIENHSTELKTKNITAIDSLLKIIEKYQTRLKEEKYLVYMDILKEFLEEIDFYSIFASDDKEENRLENVQTLFNDMASFLKSNPDTTFEEYLQNITLYTAQDEITDGDFVSLMTVHTAKGLEFKYVFLIALNEAIFPSLKTINESAYLGLEEERRLCYVAITRAKEGLYLSCSNNYSYVTESRLSPSRFFKEAGITFEQRIVEVFPGGEKEIESAGAQTKVMNWQVGDKIIHTFLGEGEVIDVEDDAIIEVLFKEHGKKRLMANHPSIKRIEHYPEAKA